MRKACSAPLGKASPLKVIASFTAQVQTVEWWIGSSVSAPWFLRLFTWGVGETAAEPELSSESVPTKHTAGRSSTTGKVGPGLSWDMTKHLRPLDHMVKDHLILSSENLQSALSRLSGAQNPEIIHDHYMCAHVRSWTTLFKAKNLKSS